MGIGEVQRQSSIAFTLQIALTIIGFFSTIYFAHAVGASVLGAYFLFITYYGIIGFVTDGGFGGAAIKRISEGKETDAFFSAYFVLRSLFVTIVIVALIMLRGYFIDLDSAGMFIWLILAIIVSLFLGGVQASIQGCGKMGISAVCGFVNDLSRIVIQVVAVFLGFGIAGLAGGFVAGLLASTLIGLRFFDHHFTRFSKHHIKSLLTFSFWLFLTSSGGLIYSYSDTVLIGYFLGNADVGVYRVVMQFTTFALITTSALRGVLWPKVSRWGKTGEVGNIEESLSRAFTYSLVIATPVIAGGIMLGNRLLYFLYGQEFASGYMTLIILLLFQMVNVFQFFFTMYLGALDHQKDAFKVTIIPVIANIILNLYLIPVIGIEGAAIATLITVLLNAILARSALSKIMKIKIDNYSLLNVLKVTGIMSLFVGGYRLFVPLSTVWLTLIPVIFGALLYGILMLKFDRKINCELKGMFIQMKIPWPRWL